jgi:hypothetical protein
VRSETRCPGCGARLQPDARVCDWCGRPVLLRDRRQPVRVLWTVGAIICVLGALAAAVFALLNSPRTFAPAPEPSPTSVPQLGTPLPRAGVPTPAPAPEPEPPPEEYVRVANTAGQGLTLRREPSVSAARVAARAENTVLRVVGPDETVDGRVWKQVEDSQGLRGWAPAEFLQPASAPGG